ncbi:MAG TPA: tetratricopeptide repeat protein, partial [Acidobacteriota bacterium]|nr:tetratricopeptide repeat protein [Acidobacteriota bacterium]
MTASQKTAAKWRAEAERWEQEGVSDAAQACWERALELEPDDLPSLFGLGWIWLRKYRLPKARRYFEQVLARDPRWRGGEAARALEKVRIEEVGVEQGFNACRQMLRVDNFCAEAFAALGSNYLRAGKLELAISNFEDALNTGWEDRFRTLMDKGQAHAELGDDAAAAECFAQAAEAEGAYRFWALYEHAAALRRLGRRAEALQLVRQAQALDPADASLRWLEAT